VVILCQHGGASCGACCGLYNRHDLSRQAAAADLRRNTAALAEVPRTAAAFRAVAARRTRELPARLFPSVRNCPLLGYLDAEESRVGCLAHPAATGGPDLRACGVYDVITCDAFLCPSHAYLTEEEAALATAAGDFYLYGLVVTDAAFLQAVLHGIAAGAGRRPAAADLAHPPFRRALEQLLALKEELAPGSEGHFGAFRKRPAGWEAPAGPPAERIADCLGADALSGNDGDGLEAEVGRRLEDCVRALPRAQAAPAPAAAPPRR
jgi:hypothetical protein